MSDFIPIYSTDNIWRGNDIIRSLTGDLDEMATNIATLETGKVNKVSGKVLSSNDYTDAEKNNLAELVGHTHNIFTSLTEIGLTTFPVTMRRLTEVMPKNSMLHIDTRHLYSGVSGYSDQVISDWGMDVNGVALILKGETSARMTMVIIYGSTLASHTNLMYGNYAYEADTVNWFSTYDEFNNKVDKIRKYAAIDLNTLTETGLYYVSDETTALNCPAGSNGHILVMSDGTRVRQVFFRVGTVNTNNYQWYSRSLGSDTTVGDNGWSKWWLLSGTEKIWNGGTVLNSEINIGSRYGCQSWVVVARLQNTGAMASVVIPRAFLTDDTDLYRFQIADETAFISFYIYYKSDGDVYLKVIDQTNSEYTTLKYVYRMS